MEYEIRNMQEADWSIVREIYNQALLEGRSTFQTECPDYPEWNGKQWVQGNRLS